MRFFSSFFIIVAFSACQTPQQPSPRPVASAPPISVADATDSTQSEAALIESVLSSVSRSKFDYKLSPADLLEITVFREEDLTRTVRVSQQGTVSYPLVGTVELGGMTVVEAEQKISKNLASFLVDPQVTIFVKEYGNKQVYVLGEVKTPGSYDLPTESSLTALQAISKAGGFTPVAGKDRTKIIRTGKDGKNLSIQIPVSEITINGQKDKDVALQPNDVVFVPQSYF